MRARNLGAAAMLVCAGMAAGQVTPGTIRIDLLPVAGGLVSPILGVGAGDGSGRLFIVDQSGKILILQNGVVLPTPFLNLTSELPTLAAGFDERGLLGLAFHPNYAQNGRFFVRYSKPRTGAAGEPCFGTSRGCHEEILAEYRVSAADPNVADPAGTILFRVNEPEFNHNGGDVAFGPDGYLYFTLGDGGGANDGLHLTPPAHGPIGSGQNLETHLGKVLRIDVNVARPALYAIPATNPFANSAGLDEIWAYGLRNPYRFSFDSRPGGTGQMYLTDVGQNLFEELNIGQIGANYGWVIMEGPICFDPLNPNSPLSTCNNAGMTLPAAYYGRSDGIAVIGGFVYRGGAMPGLLGKYVFGEFSLSFGAPTGRLFYIDTAGPLSQIREFRIGAEGRALGMFLKGYGQDEAGELYVMASPRLGPTGADAMVMKIVPCYANCDGSTQSPALNVNDFTCFSNLFAAGDARANCDLSTAAPTLNVNDFLCFINRFSAGCP